MPLSVEIEEDDHGDGAFARAIDVERLANRDRAVPLDQHLILGPLRHAEHDSGIENYSGEAEKR